MDRLVGDDHVPHAVLFAQRIDIVHVDHRAEAEKVELAADHLGLESLFAQQLFAVAVFLAAGCRQNINAVGIPRPVALQDHLVLGGIADIGAEFG